MYIFINIKHKYIMCKTASRPVWILRQTKVQKVRKIKNLRRHTINDNNLAYFIMFY